MHYNSMLLQLNKTATRLAEAMYITFQPLHTASWQMDKLSSWVDPLDVADGASKGLHCVNRAVAFLDKTGSSPSKVYLESPDAALLKWDSPLPFPTPLYRQPDLSLGAHMMLFNNIWNTNYPFW